MASLPPPTSQAQHPDLTSTTHAFTTNPSLHRAASFSAEPFLKVMDNLLRNPNITSSHLFRADILWDSDNDASFDPLAMHPSLFSDGISLLSPQRRSGELGCAPAPATAPDLGAFVKHMRPALRPWKMHMPDWRLQRTVVRQLVPRNPQLDEPLVQTCHFFTRPWTGDGEAGGGGKVDVLVRDGEDGNNNVDNGNEGEHEDEDEATLIVYLPHAYNIEDVPWYHPPLRAIGFLHFPNEQDRDSKDLNDREDASKQPYTFAIYTCAFAQVYTSSSNGHAEVQSPTPPSSTSHAVPEPPPPTTKQPPPPTHSSAKTTRTTRTLHNLLLTIHKHATTQHAASYVKRAHHDRLIPQKRLQDTYARLKARHAKTLLAAWSEQTDATKGVFEDLGVAAFCVELWRGWGWVPSVREGISGGDGRERTTPGGRGPFPGFVDLACGNGVLVYILLMEGYEGWGFDARSRRTWERLPAFVRERLEECVLVPGVLDAVSDSGVLGLTGTATDGVNGSGDGGGVEAAALPFGGLENGADDELAVPMTKITPSNEPSARPNPIHLAQRTRPARPPPRIHNGVFPTNTFLISNHADELTCWTPLLAYLNASSFIAIPCCSHDLSGARTRFPASFGGCDEDDGDRIECKGQEDGMGHLQVDQDVSLGSIDGSTQKANHSAYATLCGYVSHLTREVGYVAQKEELRIPSTRNVCIVGTPHKRSAEDANDDVVGESRDEDDEREDCTQREDVVRGLIERETHSSLAEVRKQFTLRAMGPRVWGGKGGNH